MSKQKMFFLWQLQFRLKDKLKLQHLSQLRQHICNQAVMLFKFERLCGLEEM